MTNLPPSMTVNDLPQDSHPPKCHRCKHEMVQCPCGNEVCMNDTCRSCPVPVTADNLAEVLHHLGVCSVDCALRYAKKV